MTKEQRLHQAMADRQFIRFSTCFEESAVRGYVFDIGPKFLLVGVVSDQVWLDGFACFRIADVRDLRPDPYATFEEAALKKRGERRPRKPQVELTNIETLLTSANAAFPLVTIHRERIDPDVCWIGRVMSIERGRVALLEIGPDATWDKEATNFRLSEITRVEFGGDYEDALSLVGGAPTGGGE
jgi:hypothetical protein